MTLTSDILSPDPKVDNYMLLPTRCKILSLKCSKVEALTVLSPDLIDGFKESYF